MTNGRKKDADKEPAADDGGGYGVGPAGLTVDELLKQAHSDKTDDGGTG